MLLSGCSNADMTAANSAAGPDYDKNARELIRKKESLTRFYKPMQIRSGDWLEAHPEDGETFEQYIDSRPTLPTKVRQTIYIQPVGKFSADQKWAINKTSEYMRAFYNLPVVLRDAVPVGRVPDDMTRTQYPNNVQIRTSYFLDDLLPKQLPSDAAALICLTSNDLFPGDTWNYVFGQASLEKRVGVWSLWRLNKNNGKPASRDLLLARTLKIAMHEVGHMFSMRHCTKYECLMSGTNSLDETDRRPLDACPECAAKISWAMKYPLVDRYNNLAAFWKKLRRSSEENRMSDMADALCTNCK
jgi:archaemetzincin